MKCLCSFVCLILVLRPRVVQSVPVQPVTSGCFRAAVLDQVHQVDVNSPEKTIEANLELYERSAQIAKQNGADIIVFPEEGVVFQPHNRQQTLQYGESIPDKKTQVCTEAFANSNPVLHRLACIAKHNAMFVAGDLIDVQPCLNSSTLKCPTDNKYAFNTAILIDREGNFLAKYHKIHLFGELAKNVPPSEEMVVVQTEIGRLGLQVCFDMIYKSPGHLMASNHLIDTLVFPTWWFDEMPFLSASQFQMSWSFAHKVNVLAADIHAPPIGTKGSGIYIGSRQQFEVINNIDANTRLLVASLPISASSGARCPLNVTTIDITQKLPEINPKEKVTYYHLNLNLTNTLLSKLEADKNHVMSGYEGVSCKLEYQMDNSSLSTEDEFYLIASNRTKPGPFPFAEEFCALIHCPNKIQKCSEIQSDKVLQSKFTFVQLYGEFGANSTVYPSVIGSQHQVMQKADLWSYEKVGMQNTQSKQKYLITVGHRDGHKPHPLGTVGLYGRAYERDPPFVQRSTGLFD